MIVIRISKDASESTLYPKNNENIYKINEYSLKEKESDLVSKKENL
jgi:hypothetical protein